MGKPAQNASAVAAPACRARGGGCSARKAAKRAIYPWINSQIVAVAESGNFAQLVATIQIHAPQMNLVNLATALHRLARLAQGDAGAQLLLQEGAVVANLANHVQAALLRAQASAGPPQCQALANITWSHATMQYVDRPLLNLIADIALRSISGFKPFELSTILWAFAKLGTYDPTIWDVGSDLFELGACRVAGAPEDFPFRCLVMTAWAFATAGHHDQDLFAGIAPRMMSLAHSGSCRELATALWAFCSAGVRDDRLFLEITRRATPRLEELTEEELKIMLRNLASVGFVPKAFMEHAVKVAGNMGEEAQRVARALLVLAVPYGDGAADCHCPRRPHAGSNASTHSGSSRGGRPHASSGWSSSASEVSAETEEQPGAARRRPRRQCRTPFGERPDRKSEAKNAERQRRSHSDASPCASPVPEAEAASSAQAEEEEQASSAADIPEDSNHGAMPKSGDEPAPKSGTCDTGEEGGELATSRRASAACWDSSSQWGHLVRVKNTFLHINDEDDEDDPVAYDALNRPLPPSLDIIPTDVSPERLAAYRTDYQRFRAGSAAGARGELSTSVA